MKLGPSGPGLHPLPPPSSSHGGKLTLEVELLSNLRAHSRLLSPDTVRLTPSLLSPDTVRLTSIQQLFKARVCGVRHCGHGEKQSRFSLETLNLITEGNSFNLWRSEDSMA